MRKKPRRSLYGKTMKTERVVTNVSKSTLKALKRAAKNTGKSLAAIVERGCFLVIREGNAMDADDLARETVEKILTDAGLKLRTDLGVWTRNYLAEAARPAAEKILADAGLQEASEQPASAPDSLD